MRRKKGRDKPRGKKRHRKQADLPKLNVKPYQGPKKTYVPRAYIEWSQQIPPFAPKRTLEDIIGLSVLHGEENPASKLMDEGRKPTKPIR